MEHSPCVCVCVCVGGGGGGGGILGGPSGGGGGKEGPPTKTCNDVVNDVLKMLTDQNYTMFLNIENDYYR